jgi:hypothetical protein
VYSEKLLMMDRGTVRNMQFFIPKIHLRNWCIYLELRPDSARKLYDIYHCCVYSEKLLMMDRGTVRNMHIFIPKIHLRNWCIYLELRPDPARKLSANLYDIYHCCVYSEKPLMMERGTVQNM